ncbi:MAG: hypothetical protein ACTSR8_07375 [Promethearchaeota archaeon]
MNVSFPPGLFLFGQCCHNDIEERKCSISIYDMGSYAMVCCSIRFWRYYNNYILKKGTTYCCWFAL